MSCKRREGREQRVGSWGGDGDRSSLVFVKVSGSIFYFSPFLDPSGERGIEGE